MGLDSVELILAWEDAFNISLSDEEAQNIRTPRDVIDLIYSKVKNETLPEDGGCLTLRAYYRLKDAYQKNATHSGIKFSPGTKTKTILSAQDRQGHLDLITQVAGFLPIKLPSIFLFSGLRRIRDLVGRTVIMNHATLRKPLHDWSRQQVREIVRLITMEQLNIKRFDDRAHFVRDLGVS